ncbi:hypothetical protein MLD38_008142 [Melastoma candidum]|uniref:Uncharacterized protein n=1 Tax=Melastoma candidum TaxID=119954 RepID=A0ACB9RXP0_9MYRT|nr:hypothetical protein MLD38_008142 [Melastoma candidum]
MTKPTHCKKLFDNNPQILLSRHPRKPIPPSVNFLFFFSRSDQKNPRSSVFQNSPVSSSSSSTLFFFLNVKETTVVASSTRRLLSDTGAFADWAAAAASSSAVSSSSAADLSLGFNAAAASRPTPSALNYGHPFATDSVANPSGGGNPNLAMLGLRDVFVVAPTSFHHHLHHHSSEPVHPANPPAHLSNPATALGVGVGVNVIPLLTATPCLASQSGTGMPDESENSIYNASGSRNRWSGVGGGGGGSGGIKLWQNPHHLPQQPQAPSQLPQAPHNFSHSYLKKPSAVTSTALLDANEHLGSAGLVRIGGSGESGTGAVVTAGMSNSSGGTATCQDCGNQAKKDCIYRRCRTCCKSRGFDCATHVKSTWVPAARRRERQIMAATAAVGGGTTVRSSGSTSGAKKPRLIPSQTTTTSHTSTSNTTPPRSFDTSSSRQDASFRETMPGQVCVPAVFKCVKVTAVEDGEDEYAYQAVVKIGGHVFKGFLYDQGSDGREGFPNLSELHLGGGSSSGGGGGGRNNNGTSSSSPNLLVPTDPYAAASGGELLGIGGGSGYGNPLN